MYIWTAKIKSKAKKMKSKKAEIEFMLSDKVADVEVLRLFIPDGKDISFNGVIINVKDSADGLPHKVNNFDDFYKYVGHKEHLGLDLRTIIDN